MNKPQLAVLYGQPDFLSTSFQTTQLVGALRPWFEPIFLRMNGGGGGLLRQQWARLATNYLKPLLAQPKAPFVLYANDGLADLRKWRTTRLLYWYDAPCDWSTTPPRIFEWAHWLRYQNVQAADYVFAVSGIQVKVAQRIRPGRESSVHYLPVGVDCHAFDPGRANPEEARREFGLPSKTIIGYLGYLGVWGDRFAGQPLVEIAPDLLRQNAAHFLIIGSGPALPLFKQQVAKLGLEKHFTFTGFVRSEVLPSCLTAMDICIDTLEKGFHSEARSETKLKQYMAMGRACVATAIGENCVDLDNGRCGLLVQPGNSELLQAIKLLCSAPNRRAELGGLARRRAEEVYHWPKLAERLATVVLLPK